MSKVFYQSIALPTTGVVATGTSSGVVDCRALGSLAIATNITVDTNAAKTFATGAIGTNVITLTAHGYKTGLVGQLTTTGALPTGLSLATNYYIVVIDANTVSLATSQANALAAAPVVVSFTSSGASGTGTFTPTALAGATVQAQWSNDQSVWIGIGSPTSISAALQFGFTQDRPSFAYVKFNFVITSGSLTIGTTATTNKDS